MGGGIGTSFQVHPRGYVHSTPCMPWDGSPGSVPTLPPHISKKSPYMDDTVLAHEDWPPLRMLSAGLAGPSVRKRMGSGPTEKQGPENHHKVFGSCLRDFD